MRRPRPLCRLIVLLTKVRSTSRLKDS